MAQLNYFVLAAVIIVIIYCRRFQARQVYDLARFWMC